MTGYQLHVRTFTLHTVLKAVGDSYVPPRPPSVDVRSATTASSASARDRLKLNKNMSSHMMPFVDQHVIESLRSC